MQTSCYCCCLPVVLSYSPVETSGCSACADRLKYISALLIQGRVTIDKKNLTVAHTDVKSNNSPT